DVLVEHQALRLAVEHPLGLERGQRPLRGQVGGEGRGLGPRVFAEEVVDHLVELAPFDEAALPQVPDEPFTLAEFARHHVAVILPGGERTPRPRPGLAGGGIPYFSCRANLGWGIGRSNRAGPFSAPAGTAILFRTPRRVRPTAPRDREWPPTRTT